MSEVAVEIVVRGRVQGVGFRAWTRREAAARGLAGSAVNRPDGGVEIHAEGDGAAVDDLVTLLRGDATPGDVSSVDVESADVVGARGFAVG